MGVAKGKGVAKVDCYGIIQIKTFLSWRFLLPGAMLLSIEGTLSM